LSNENLFVNRLLLKQKVETSEGKNNSGTEHYVVAGLQLKVSVPVGFGPTAE
jgi:hypothetical protein